MFIIWKTNLDAICEAILPRAIDCFQQASELLAAQERAEGEVQAVAGFQTAMDRAKAMLKGADAAARAVGYFENTVQGRFKICSLYESPSPLRTALTPTESMDYIRAYYRAKTLATLAKGPLPCHILSSLDMLAYRQMKDAMDCLMMNRAYIRNAYRSSIGVALGENWPLICRKIRAFHHDLGLLPSNRYLDVGCFLAYKYYRNPANPNRGARLSDLLPLVRDLGRHYRNKAYELSSP